MQQGRELGFNDYVAMARRRLNCIIPPVIIFTILGLAVTFVLSPSYKSIALILVDQQSVSGDYVKPIVYGDLASRLSNTKEQIFSRTRLQPMIERLGLYANSRMSLDEKANQLRKDVTVAPVRPDPSHGFGSSPGFTIEAQQPTAKLAQQVCAEVVSMFLTENLKSRAQFAENTAEFLQAQLDNAKRSLDDQDAKVAAFQRQYVGQMPGQEQTNFNMMTTLSTQLEAATQALNRAQQDESYTEAMLAQQEAAAASATGPADAPPPQQMANRIAQLREQLAALESRYTPDYPEVTKVRRELEEMNQQMAQTPTASAVGGEKRRPLFESPAVQQLRAQVHSLKVGINEKKDEQSRIQQQLRLYQSRVQLTPMVQEQYKELTRDYDTALKFYNDLLGKRNQSEMATDLERSQQGEQLRMMEPPSFPNSPSFPNRLQFALGGLAVGLLTGSGLAVWAEFRDRSLRNERDVLFFTQMETLAMIPDIPGTYEPRAQVGNR